MKLITDLMIFILYDKRCKFRRSHNVIYYIVTVSIKFSEILLQAKSRLARARVDTEVVAWE